MKITKSQLKQIIREELGRPETELDHAQVYIDKFNRAMENLYAGIAGLGQGRGLWGAAQAAAVAAEKAFDALKRD